MKKKKKKKGGEATPTTSTHASKQQSHAKPPSSSNRIHGCSSNSRADHRSAGSHAIIDLMNDKNSVRALSVEFSRPLDADVVVDRYSEYRSSTCSSAFADTGATCESSHRPFSSKYVAIGLESSIPSGGEIGARFRQCGCSSRNLGVGDGIPPLRV